MAIPLLNQRLTISNYPSDYILGFASFRHVEPVLTKNFKQRIPSIVSRIKLNWEFGIGDADESFSFRIYGFIL